MSTDLVQRARMVFAVDASANGTKLPPATVHMQFSSLCHTIFDQIRSGRFRFARKCRFKLKSIHFEVGRSPCCLISIFWYLGSSFGFGQSRLAVLRDVSGLEPQFFPALPVLPAENLEGQLHCAFPGK